MNFTNEEENIKNLSKTSVTIQYLHTKSERSSKSSEWTQNNNIDLTERSPCLVFPVDELQVDWGSRAKQAMSFGLDIISERWHTDMEPLNDLPKEAKTHKC